MTGREHLGQSTLTCKCCSPRREAWHQLRFARARLLACASNALTCLGLGGTGSCCPGVLGGQTAAAALRRQLPSSRHWQCQPGRAVHLGKARAMVARATARSGARSAVRFAANLRLPGWARYRRKGWQSHLVIPGQFRSVTTRLHSQETKTSPKMSSVCVCLPRLSPPSGDPSRLPPCRICSHLGHHRVGVPC